MELPVLRRTKIVCTLGPATDDMAVLEKVLLAGANVVRLNFSHGQADDHINRADKVREIAQKHDLTVAILADLQGPKIRISRFKDGPIELELGDRFTLDADLDDEAGNQEQVGLGYKTLPQEVKPDDVLLLDDGRVQLKVLAVDGNKVICETVIAGKLSNNKGINLKGGGLAAPALTKKDLADIKTAAKIDVDYVAVSFPRDEKDIQSARKFLQEAGSEAGIVAKIERAETVADDEILKKIIIASDAVMVARGDLGVEIGDAELIGVQKKIIQNARHNKRVVITATQMMESMINSPIPTRAEVFDVANSVLDGTDAVMLSAETAAGKFPVEVIHAMTRACLGAEKHPDSQRSRHRIDREFEFIDEAIAMATMYTANHLQGVTAIICLTESGSTPLWMSRIRSGIPIYALARHKRTQRKVMLYRGVEAMEFNATSIPYDEVPRAAVDAVLEQGCVQSGDTVIVTLGELHGVHGGTNSLKVMTV